MLLRSTAYFSPIDVWAVGCIMAELCTTQPLFSSSYEAVPKVKFLSQVLLRSTAYSRPIDVWAVGCIMAELYTM